MEERQPRAAAVALLAVERLDDLDDVGGQVEVGDLHTRGDAGRPGRVLQVGDGVLGDVLDRHPGGADLVGHRVDGDDARTLLGRPAAEELADALGRLGGGQDGRRLAVVEHGVQAADVAGFRRVEQRHRDAARVERAVQRDHVLEVLRAEDRHSVARLGDLLQPRGDRTVARAEVGPVQLARHTVAFDGEVEEPVGELVATNLGPLLDVLDHAAVVGELDQSVLQERVVKAAHSHSPVEATVSRSQFAVVTGGTPQSANRANPKPRRSYRGVDVHRRITDQTPIRWPHMGL